MHIAEKKVRSPLHNIEPHAYLTATLKAIVNGHKQSQIHELLPWDYSMTERQSALEAFAKLFGHATFTSQTTI